MVIKPEQQQMQMLLTEAITVLCKNGLQYRSHFNVEGLLGITLDDEDVFLVSIKQTVKGGEAGDSSIDVHLNKQVFEKKPVVNTSPISRAKQRKKRKRSTDSIERLTSNNIPLNNNNPEKRNSNVPYVIKPEPEVWNEGKLNRAKQEDNFDDSASSPGELIVVREDNLTDVERAQIENQFSQKEKLPHSRSATAAQKLQQSSESKDNHSSNAIYASSNGQIDAPRSSPYQAWESPYGAGTSTPTSEAPNDSGPEDRAFQQTRGMTTGGCQATLGMRGDVTVDGDSLVGDGGEAAATTGTTTVQSPTAGYRFPDYTPPPNTGSSSSRRKRKSTAVMRRGIPSTSPRSIPQVSPPDRNDLPIDDNMRYYCSICDKTFSRQFSWKVHMNVHRGIFPYTCSVCGKGFTSHINLKGHLVQHTNRREFKCAACGKEFIYKRGLNAHIPICKGTQNGECVYEQAV